MLTITSVMLLAAAVVDPRVDDVFRTYDHTDSPGCAVGVFQNGSVVFAKGYGMANLEHGVPIRPDTVFYVGSVSKQFTAMSVALAAKQGKLSLDDAVQKLLPELRAFGTPMTLRHFVHHTSGLREKWDLLAMSGWRDGDVVTLDDVLDRAGRLMELNFAPGEEHLYNNTGYDLLSIGIERATGESLASFARKHIFEPLGMNDTRFVDDRTLLIPRRATGYSPRAEDGFRVDLPNVTTTGSGSVYTTVQDLALWDESFYVGTLGGPELVDLVETPGVLNDGTRLTYAFGLSADDFHGLRRVEHGGALAGYRAQITRFPEKHLTVTALCNRSDAVPGDLVEAVAVKWLGLASDEAAVPSGSIDVAPGTFFDERTGLVEQLRYQDGALKLRRGDELRPLVAMGPETFRWPGDGIARFDPSGGKFTLTARDARPAVYVRQESYDPTPSEIEPFAGAYRSDELDVTWSFLASDELRLKRWRFSDETLEPLFRDAFRSSLGVVLFRRDDEGAVRGFTISTGRTRHVRFDRQ